MYSHPKYHLDFFKMAVLHKVLPIHWLPCVVKAAELL